MKNLIGSLKEFNIPYDIENINSVGEWINNCNQKPSFIKRKMSEYDKDIVWIDADAVIKQYPVYFDYIEEDVGVYVENLIKPQTGTVFLKNNSKVLCFIDRWIDKCKVNQKGHDGHNFPSLHQFFTGELSLFVLPQSYYQIFDIRNNGKAVIEHYQASRKFRS